MEPSRLSRKRPAVDQRAPVCMKKASLGWYQTGRRGRTRQTTSCRGSETCVNEVRNQGGSFSQVLKSWVNTKDSVSRVLEHLRVRTDSRDVFLGDEVNRKCLEFHGDITEECGSGDKQHSWAVIEKPKEIFFYGPYFPDQGRWGHSEDAVVQKTQELLETEDVSADWKIYIFTQSSPCLARTAEPCMLKLARKAREWWNEKGVKTHIGYLKCWGFKGLKENLFRDLNYSHLVCIDQSRDHQSYVKAVEKMAAPVGENLFSAVKRVQQPLAFPLIKPEQGPAWKAHFRRLYALLPGDESFAREVSAAVGAARRLLWERSESLEECVERGRAFANDRAFGPRSDTRDGARATFGQCWKEMVEEKYAEFVREELTLRFNRAAVQVFSEDVANLEYLKIGMVRFS